MSSSSASQSSVAPLGKSPVGISAESALEIVYIGYVGGLGGEAVQMLELATGVAARGQKVTVVMPDMEGTRKLAAAYQGRHPNLRLELTPLIRFDTGSQKPADVFGLLYRYQRASVLHLHTGDICIPRMTLLALEALQSLPGAPALFATIHCPYPEMTPGSPRARYWASAASRRFTGIICPSRHGRETQVAYGVRADRALTIYNGVDADRFVAGNGATVRATLGLAADVPLVVSTARLYDQKRPLDAVDAFAGIAPEFPTARLALVGSGPLEEVVRERIREHNLVDRVTLAGHQTNVPDWLAAADVWLCTSDAENFSLSVLEAMSAGCAIVATWCRGNDEALKPGENALTAPVGDIPALSEALRTALSDAPLRLRLKEGARESARAFTVQTMVDHHLELYTKRKRSLRKGP